MILPILLAGVLVSADSSWEKVAERDGIVSYKKALPGSAFFAFRGEGLVKAKIGKLLTVLLTPERSPEWVGLLVDVAPLEKGNMTHVVWEHYDNPWPVTDRDFLYQAVAKPDAATKTVSIHYKSVSRTEVPQQDCCVRGDIKDTYFKLTARPDGSTWVECEVVLDPKGWLPTWVVNMVQKDWPIGTIDGLREQTAKKDIAMHPATSGW